MGGAKKKDRERKNLPRAIIGMTTVTARTFPSRKYRVDPGAVGIHAGAHSIPEQFARDRVMVEFRILSTRVLAATDVAARGIDLEALDTKPSEARIQGKRFKVELVK
jgi:hypothetical protein